MNAPAMKSTTHPEAQGQEPEIYIDPSTRGTAEDTAAANERIDQQRQAAQESGRLMVKSHIDGDVMPIQDFHQQIADTKASIHRLPLSQVVQFGETHESSYMPGAKVSAQHFI